MVGCYVGVKNQGHWVLVAHRRSWRGFALECIPVQLHVPREIGGNVVLCKDRRHRALWLARPAVDALVWMYVKLVRSFIDAVNGADVYTGFVFYIDAGFSDYERHLGVGFESLRLESVPLSEEKCLASATIMVPILG